MRAALLLGAALAANATAPGAERADAEEVAERRLLAAFGFAVPESAVKDFLDAGGAEVSALAVKAAALTATGAAIADVVALFSASQPLLKQGVDLAGRAWASFGALAQRLRDLSAKFAPLKPVFASATGLVTLASDSALLKVLFDVVQGLLGTAGVLAELSHAVTAVLDIFRGLDDVLKRALSTLEVRGRRLAGFADLLAEMDFAKLAKQMQGHLTEMGKLAQTLTEIDQTIGPLLMKIQPDARHLADVGTFVGSSQQKAYEHAIKQVIPTWQTLERAGIRMCPAVQDAEALATSLRCRIDGFVTADGAWSAVAGLAGSGGSCAGPPRPLGCPTDCESCGIEDLLSKHAGALSWVLVAVSALGIGGAAAAALRLKAAATRPSADDSSEDAEEMDVMTPLHTTRSVTDEDE